MKGSTMNCIQCVVMMAGAVVLAASGNDFRAVLALVIAFWCDHYAHEWLLEERKDEDARVKKRRGN